MVTRSGPRKIQDLYLTTFSAHCDPRHLERLADLIR